jgi:tetratricopeptide (TPR) repeat protein
MLHLIETSEAWPQDRLKLLLLSGQILTVDHFLNDTDAHLLFEPLLQARQIAETTRDQQGMADVLSVLGQAHYFATLMARVGSGASPNSSQEQGDYHEALAYQQQALELREALHDTRGMSESLFYIGIVYERWQQRDLAVKQYTKALQTAEQFSHPFEQSEPSRHLAWDAFGQGDVEAALTYALRALSLREAASFRPHLPFDHLLLSDIYQAKGERANAVLHAEIASTLAKEMGATRAIAMTNECLARLNEQ